MTANLLSGRLDIDTLDSGDYTLTSYLSFFASVNRMFFAVSSSHESHDIYSSVGS